jgi:hypothetical protein
LSHTEIVITSPADIGHSCERAAAFAQTWYQRHFVAEVITDEREGAIGQSGGERSHCGLVGTHRRAVLVDAFEHDLVLADM